MRRGLKAFLNKALVVVAAVFLLCLLSLLAGYVIALVYTALRDSPDVLLGLLLGVAFSLTSLIVVSEVRTHG